MKSGFLAIFSFSRISLALDQAYAFPNNPRNYFRTKFPDLHVVGSTINHHTSSSGSLTVFNIDGLEIYSSTDYQDDFTGQGLNKGPYFYLIRYIAPSEPEQIKKNVVS